MWRKELTGNGYAHPSDVQRGQFITKNDCSGRDGGGFLRDTGNGHRDDACPFYDADHLQEGYNRRVVNMTEYSLELAENHTKRHDARENQIESVLDCIQK